MIEVHVAINWLLGHREILALLAVIAAGIGALYRPVRDLIKALPRFIWVVIKYTSLTIWLIIWPIRKPIAWAYTKFLSDYVYNFFDRILDSFEKREAAKEKLHDNNSNIETVEL